MPIVNEYGPMPSIIGSASYQSARDITASKLALEQAQREQAIAADLARMKAQQDFAREQAAAQREADRERMGLGLQSDIYRAMIGQEFDMQKLAQQQENQKELIGLQGKKEIEIKSQEQKQAVDRLESQLQELNKGKGYGLYGSLDDEQRAHAILQVQQELLGIKNTQWPTSAQKIFDDTVITDPKTGERFSVSMRNGAAHVVPLDKPDKRDYRKEALATWEVLHKNELNDPNAVIDKAKMMTEVNEIEVELRRQADSIKKGLPTTSSNTGSDTGTDVTTNAKTDYRGEDWFLTGGLSPAVSYARELAGNTPSLLREAYATPPPQIDAAKEPTKAKTQQLGALTQQMLKMPDAELNRHVQLLQHWNWLLEGAKTEAEKAKYAKRIRSEMMILGLI